MDFRALPCLVLNQCSPGTHSTFLTLLLLLLWCSHTLLRPFLPPLLVLPSNSELPLPRKKGWAGGRRTDEHTERLAHLQTSTHAARRTHARTNARTHARKHARTHARKGTIAECLPTRRHSVASVEISFQFVSFGGAPNQQRGFPLRH